MTQDEDGDLRVDGSSDAQRIWVDRVPERRTGKDRVHLDVVGDVAELRRTVERLGGRHIVDRDGWTVVADPEGGELCLFAPPAAPALVVDAQHPVEVARWWAGVFDVMKFVAVPEPRAAKNRRHWDLWCDDVPALVSRGATVLRDPDDEISWTVLADPEGNEFCAFAP